MLRRLSETLNTYSLKNLDLFTGVIYIGLPALAHTAYPGDYWRKKG
jgi:hypothetical protein